MKTLLYFLFASLFICPLAFGEEDTIEFDPSLLQSLSQGAEQASPSSVYPDPTRSQGRNSSQNRRDKAVFNGMLDFFYNYVNSFTMRRETRYATVGDFREHYLKNIVKSLPNLYLQGEAYRIIAATREGSFRIEGGGGGVRYEASPLGRDVLSIAMMPFYGEKRRFSSTAWGIHSGSELIWRVSSGISYRKRIKGDLVEPGVEILFQPQMLNFDQFRVYAEAFVKMKLIDNKNNKAGGWIVEELSVIPKAVLWRSTDRDAFDGTAVRNSIGDKGLNLDQNVYGFLNFELNFRR